MSVFDFPVRMNLLFSVGVRLRSVRVLNRCFVVVVMIRFVVSICRVMSVFNLPVSVRLRILSMLMSSFSMSMLLVLRMLSIMLLFMLFTTSGMCMLNLTMGVLLPLMLMGSRTVWVVYVG